MRKIVAGLFISLDGVTQGPGPSDDFVHAGWTMPYFSNEIGAHIGAQTMASDALLLGRLTYETFRTAFAQQTGGAADGMNNFRKYVVSTTLQSADWNNTTVINGDIVAEIAKLKEQPGKDITISGSTTLIQSLARHNLIDEYSLLVHPVVLGTGKRLFEEGMDKFSLNLIEARPLPNGVIIQRYQPAK
jgi:dihydrofolate reductase